MYTTLQIEIPLPLHVGERLLSKVAPAGNPQKARRITLLSADDSPLEIAVLQPGQRSPTKTVSITYALDLSSLVVRKGLTNNVVRKFVPTLIELGRIRLQQLVGEETIQGFEVSGEQGRLTKLSCSYYFDFGSEFASLDALYRLHKHLKVRLDCAARYPGGRQTQATHSPRVTSDPEARHAFTAELAHSPLRETFGHARFSVARDTADIPSRLAVGAIEDRAALVSRLRQILRVDVTIEAGKLFPVDDGGLMAVPQSPIDLATMKTNLVEDVWTGFRWATWINDDFLNDTHQAEGMELTPAVRELLDVYFAGGDVMDHYVIQRRPEEFWAAAGFMDTLLRWKMKSEVGHGNEKAVQPRVQA